MKKGIVLGVTAVTTCLLLTGCHLKHEWAEATCTEPRTCTVGGETEGEPLGHVWMEATCTEPKTCSVCGQTEGEPLGHEWEAANYQEPKTCSVCGETEGEPLIPSFEEHGLVINAVEGVTYDYITECYEDTSKKTVAHLTFSDYQIVGNLEGFENIEGYEWRTLHTTIVFDDENANDYGFSWWVSWEDYYDIEGLDSSYYYDDINELSYWSVNYHGVDYPECARYQTFESSGWKGNSNTIQIDTYIRVPIGYDGVVIEAFDYGFDWSYGEYIYDLADENTLFFRMN